MRRRGYTLIELLIGVALGALVVYSAFAALRVAAQSVSVANRLGARNALMRAGFLAAEDEVDFWTRVDDPANAARQRLRQLDTQGGLPFTPFSESFAREAAPDPDRRELDTGWDRDDQRWAAHEPSGWWRGNMAERGESDQRFGRYAAFASAEPEVTLGDALGLGLPTYGPVAPEHRWLYRQCRGLMRGLGYYGLMEYAPANWQFTWYDDVVGDHTPGGQPRLTCFPWTQFNNGDGAQHGARGKYRLTYMTSYALCDPERDGGLRLNVLYGDHHRYYKTGYEATPATMSEFTERTLAPRELLPLRPAHWPKLEVSVARFYKNTRSVAMCRVRLVDPLTGEASELAYASLGTNLRGARQQRRHPALGGGWSRWDNATAALAADHDDLDSYPGTP